MCLCVQTIWNLVRGHGKSNVYEEIISLQFNVHDTSQHICKQCLRKLQKRHGLRTNLRELDEEIFQSYSSKAYKGGLSIKKKTVKVHDESVSPEKKNSFRGIVRWLFERWWLDSFSSTPKQRKTGIKLQCTTQMWRSHYPWKFNILQTTVKSWAKSHTDIAGNNHIHGQRNYMHACSYSDPGISEKASQRN